MLRSRTRKYSSPVVEPVENRVLFAVNVAGQAFNPGQPQLVFTDIATGNTNGSGATAAQAATITNTGSSNVTVSGASIVDDPGVSGDDSGQFEADSFPSFPVTLTPGAQLTLNVRMRASSIGLKSAILRVSTSDGTQDIDLRGIGTASDSSGEVGGQLEPSLQRILNAFQIPVNVGDADGEGSVSFPTPRPAGTANEEVSMPRLVKAGGGPVVIETLAAYQFNNKVGPSTHFGYYTPGTPDAKTELYTIALGNNASTTPGGGSSFDPGSSPFALYDTFNGSIFESNGLPRTSYSEDLFNTWASNVKQKVRFFPLKNTNGSVVPNAFIFTTEDFDGSSATAFDNNDLVGVIRNVAAAPSGPEVGTASLDRGLPGPTRLVMNRIQQQPPDPRQNPDGTTTDLPNNVVHDKATLRVYNSGNAPLTITSAVLSNTTDFRINTPNVNGATIAAGSSLDVEVQFIATSTHLHNATLTLNTNDADESALTVQLAGYWQNKSENNEEPTLQGAVNGLFGFGTVITGPGQQLSVPGQGGKVAAVGDEVLSPYWKRADPAQSVEVVQLVAYHTHPNIATFRYFLQGSTSTTNAFVQQDVDSQSVFPHLQGSGTQIAAGTFKPTKTGDSNPAFGFKVDSEWSDPTLNPQEQPGGGFGHHIRFWPLKDASGAVVPNTYLMGMDYLSINFDYQDNIYVIRNIRPAVAVSGPPAAPTGLTATGSTASVALNWSDNAEANLAGYNVYRGTSADFVPDASNKLNASLLTSSDFNDTNAPVGVASFYKVTAVNDASQESAAASASATRTDPGPGTTPPFAPAGVSATAISPTAITVSWTASANATSYSVQRRVAGTTTFAVIATNLTATSYADSGLAPDTTYEYQVTAANSAGPSSASVIASAHTSTVGGPTPIPTPTPTPTVSVSNSSVSEPTTGTTNATFTISLDQQSTAAIVVNFATADATAVAGDYTPTSGAITFMPGETSKTIDVPVVADNVDESNETFVVNLSIGSGLVTLGDAQGVGTILSSSAPPPPPSQPFGGKTIATFTGADGKPVKVVLKGPGTGEITPPDGANGATISLSGTTSASSLTITGTTTLASVNVNGALKSFTGKAVDLAGDFTLTGMIGKLLARNATGGHAINIGAGGTGTTLTLANVADLSVSSASPIKAIKAIQWTDTDSTPETLTAPAITSVTVKGDLAADLNVGTLSKLSVGGMMNGSILRATGDVGSIRAGAVRDSKIFAGVAGSVSTLPDSADDFIADATIKSFSVKLKTPGSFSDTVIASKHLGKLSLGSVATNNGGTPFGIAADDLASVSAVAGGGGAKFSVRNLSDPADSQTQDDFVLRIL